LLALISFFLAHMACLLGGLCILFTKFLSFFQTLHAWSQSISGSAIFSPNESILGAMQMIDLDIFWISQGTLPWQPIL